jgi:RNA polymerase sigma factor (sigma-70 family)
MVDGASFLRGLDTMCPIDTVDLLWFCVANRDDRAAWSEFLGRILPKVQSFVRATFHRSLGNTCSWRAQMLSNVFQEGDLVQIAIVRLFERDCALLRRFQGKTENDLFVYLAIISRSAIRDTLRRESARKRGLVQLRTPHRNDRGRVAIALHGHDESRVERTLLSHELGELGRRMLASLEGPTSVRDKLIFQLYFYDDQSLEQIAACRGIDLTKSGVAKALNRMEKQIRMLTFAGMPGAAA